MHNIRPVPAVHYVHLAFDSEAMLQVLEVIVLIAFHWVVLYVLRPSSLASCICALRWPHFQCSEMQLIFLNLGEDLEALRPINSINKNLTNIDFNHLCDPLVSS